MFAYELEQEYIDLTGPDGEPSVDWDAASCRDGTGSMTDLFFSDEIPDIIEAKRICATCPVRQPCLDYALEIIEKTRGNERLILGVSPRGSLMLQRAAQARAFIEGRDFCLPDDFKQMVLPVFAHRVVVNARYATTQKKTAQAEAILAEIIESTAVPL